MKINFSKRQYWALLKLVYLGEWMLHANTTENLDKDVEELLDHIYSYAYEFGVGDFFSKDEGSGTVSETGKLDDEFQPYIEEYNTHTFWSQLIDKLAERDFKAEYGPEAITAMSVEEYFELNDKFIEKYETEFLKHGLSNLVVK